MNSLNPSALRPFLEPESVAIAGASRASGKFSNNILRNLLTLGYSGRIYPVNPREEEILGLRAYPKVSAIPESIDLGAILHNLGRQSCWDIENSVIYGARDIPNCGIGL